MRPSARLGLVGGATLLVSACGAAASADDLPGPPTVVSVTMTENHFAYSTSIGRGRTVFVALNKGHVMHRLELVPLPKDFPPIAVQLHGTVRRPVQVIASTPQTPPGQTGSFAVDLSPGRFALVSFLIDQDGISQAVKGMATEFVVH